MACTADRALLLALINAAWTTQAIRTACALKLPDRLAHGPQDVRSLASACGCDAHALHRLLRALVTLEVCTDAGGDRYGLAPLGELLREDDAESLRAWALLAGGAHWARWGELDHSVRTGLSHRRRHEGEDGYDRLDGADAALFHRAMVALTRRVARAFAASVEIGSPRCVVDVGGGAGELLGTVLVALPQAQGVLFDLAPALEGAAALLGQAGVATRCRCIAGSFFYAVPGGGDAYLLKSVLHNWDDERAVCLLRRCRDAMSPAERLWVLERLVPAHPGSGPHDRAVAWSDLNMLVAQAGRERRLDEFETLVANAGLVLAGTTSLGDTSFSAIELRRG
jgi:hypothetical protein